MYKPPILEIIGQRVDLRKVGREFVGLCPFHSEKTPSFTVNEEKRVFYCHGCHEGGDVIDFIMKLDGVSFPDARKALGIETGNRGVAPILTVRRKRAAEVAAAWVNDQRKKFNIMIAAAMEARDIADGVGDFDLAATFDRELIMLRGFYNSLEYPRGAVEMLALRPSIEQITDRVEVTL